MIPPTFKMAHLTTKSGCAIPLRVDYSRGAPINLDRVFHFIACCLKVKLTWDHSITVNQVSGIILITESYGK